MYGLIPKAMEEMVRTTRGDACWEEIKRKAGVEIEVFVGQQPYPDAITYDLVGAASEVLAKPVTELLEAFGEYWVLETAVRHYEGIMNAAGMTLPDFLKSLNNMHTRIRMVMPELQPPNLTCTDVTQFSLKLHYRTFRRGLEHFVIGLVRGLGMHFNTPADATLIESRAAGADHDIFIVTWEAPRRTGSADDRA